jgi:heme/copper-type cytochrome/quinol oxidase subunit 2
LDEIGKNKDSIILYWIENLVGTGPRFSFNLLLSFFGGILYSFNVWSSVYVLVLFGVISPLLFTLCLYFIIRNFNEENLQEYVPRFFKSPNSNMLLMLFDMTIIIGLATLIHIGFLNYFFFRLLQTVLFPILMLFILRILFVSLTSEGDDNQQ